jgi:hypothetical protein
MKVLEHNSTSQDSTSQKEMVETFLARKDEVKPSQQNIQQPPTSPNPPLTKIGKISHVFCVLDGKYGLTFVNSGSSGNTHTYVMLNNKNH